MQIPTDGRTLTLYQSIQRGRRYWYVTWTDDAGKNRRRYLGRELPTALAPYLDAARLADERLQAAIRLFLAYPEKVEARG